MSGDLARALEAAIRKEADRCVAEIIQKDAARLSLAYHLGEHWPWLRRMARR